MLIQITSTDNILEWCILEFQGEITGAEKFREEFLGELIVKGESVDMIIGQHTLNGKVVKLPKPFLIVEKLKDASAHTMETLGVVRKKVIFSSRPKPLAKNHN